MKKAIVILAFCQIFVIVAYAQGPQGLPLLLTIEGLQEALPDSYAYFINVTGMATLSWGKYYLTEDITGNGYVFNLWSKAEPAGQIGKLKAKIEIEAIVVADTMVTVTGTDWKLYRVPVSGIDPTIVDSAEVVCTLTMEIENKTGVTISFVYGNFGQPASGIEIPPLSGMVIAVDKNGAQLARNPDLWQNYPNPFNPATQITYYLPQAEKVIVKIYNINGQLIKTLVNEFQPAGIKTVIWNGLDEQGQKAASGIYLYQLQAGAFLQSKMMILIE